MFTSHFIRLAAAALTISLATSCVPLAAGAAGGYLLHREGYRVQSPIKKVETDRSAVEYREDIPYEGYSEQY